MKIALAFITTFAVMFSAVAFAQQSQPKNGFTFEFTPMYLGVRGNDVRVGDVVKYSEVVEKNPPFTSLTYGATYEPIVPRMRHGYGFFGQGVYRRGQWGVGVSGWSFGTSGSAGGTVESPRSSQTAFRFTGVRMWDQTLVPLLNEANKPSELSPVGYWAKNELSLGAVDAFALRNLLHEKRITIEVVGGARFAKLSNLRNEGQALHAFVYNYFGRQHFDNRVHLESVSNVQSTLAGPLLGLRGNARLFKKVGLEASVAQSVLLGVSRHNNVWTDVDDIWAVEGTGTGPFARVEQRYYFDGGFSSAESQRVAVPVTEMRVVVTYAVTKRMSAGAGIFVSAWQNMPMASKWSVPGAWTAVAGTGWRPQNATLVFSGLTASLSIRL